MANADRACWISWYDLPEEGGDAHIDWLYHTYLLGALAWPGVLWGAPFRAEQHRRYVLGKGCEMLERPLVRQDETLMLAEDVLLAVHPGYDDGEVFAVACDNSMIESDKPGPCLHKTEKKVLNFRPTVACHSSGLGSDV